MVLRAARYLEVNGGRIIDRRGDTVITLSLDAMRTDEARRVMGVVLAALNAAEADGKPLWSGSR